MLESETVNFDDTIAAISTAPGVGAIAVVRMSGPEAVAIAEKIFRTSATQKETNAGGDQRALSTSHRARHGYVCYPHSGQLIDEVVATPYLAPHSYTGEDLVEISCHGGSLISREILALCVKNGCRLARPGEFTQRAFLSGRMDLTQAEAVLDLIQAKTSRQRKFALSALSGHLGERIRRLRSNIMELLTRIVAGIDFPEEVGDMPIDDIAPVIKETAKELEDLSRTARSGRFLREGIRTAIVGRPNAGKSSLLNQLLKFERAIVTDVPGTTRDSLEELLDLNGIPLILVDTAGIRSTDDTVERIGIKRTREIIKQADLVIMLVDLCQGWGAPEEEIISALEGRPYIQVGNKVDLLEQGSNVSASLAAKADGCVGQVEISALTGQGIERLCSGVENWVFMDQPKTDGYDSLNARQSQLCSRAAEALAAAQITLESGLPQDCLATDLKAALDNLSEICGEAVSEEIIHQVFANFCIGK